MPTLPHVALPHTDLTVSRLCLGADRLGTTLRGDDALRLVAEFLEAGGDFFDSAHVYAFWVPGGLGASERELGRCLRALGCRDRVTIATKGGHPDAGPDYTRPDDYLAERVLASDISESLDRLGTDRIDLYLLHRDDTRVPVGEIVDILNRQADSGRIRHFGVSNWSTARIAEANDYARAHSFRPIVASQVQWSLATPTWPTGPDPIMRTMTDTDAAFYADTALPVLAYSATANGYFSRLIPDRGPYATQANAARHARAVTLAQELNVAPTQIALAYLLHQPATVIPLFSTTNHAHLQEAIAATAISLTPEQVSFLLSNSTAA